MRNKWDYIGMLCVFSVVYIALLGIGSAFGHAPGEAVWMGLWHPVLLSFLGLIALAIVAFMKADETGCKDCFKLQKKLKETEQALQDVKL